MKRSAERKLLLICSLATCCFHSGWKDRQKLKAHSNVVGEFAWEKAVSFLAFGKSHENQPKTFLSSNNMGETFEHVCRGCFIQILISHCRSNSAWPGETWRNLGQGGHGSSLNGLCVLSYMMVHTSCQIITCSLPCLLQDIVLKEPWSTSDIGHVIGFASLAAAIGYGVHGPCIDRWGAVFGLSVALGGCCTGAGLLATSETQRQFIAGASVLRFSYAAGWPAEMKALKLMVPEEHQPMAVFALGFAWRHSGNVSLRHLDAKPHPDLAWNSSTSCLPAL